MEQTTWTTNRTRPSPLLIARGGASVEAPENTIAAFELALEQCADALVVEVHLSRDGHPVVIRDFTLERTTDGAGPVRELTVRQLKRLDSGGWGGRRFRGQRIQTLEEVLERFRGRTRLWVELRGGSDLYPGIEERVLSTLEIYDVVGNTLVLCFDGAPLACVRGLNADARLGRLLANAPAESTRADASTIDAMCPSVELVSEDSVGAIRGAGLQCYPWTVNEPALGRRLMQWGADGLITTQPGPLRAGLGWPR